MGQFKADVDILTTNDDGRRAYTPKILAVHTFEGNPWIIAEDMARYQLQRSAGGSYTGVIDRAGRTARENDDDYIPWAAMFTGNRIARHWSLAGRAAQTRADWLTQDKQLQALARVLAHDHKTYGTALRKLTVEEVRRAKTDRTVSGVCSHHDISLAFGESNHTDPGPHFPWDELIRRATQIVKNPGKETAMSQFEADVLARLERIERQLGHPGGWPQGGKRTLYDLTAAAAEKVGVPNTTDTMS